ncbi:hypothetical protein CRUP_006797 [Coryphaenoides rupestris]|nr:hypothetical protein CRUP_006797 [Coryphaenoides rupestris]
MQGEKGGVKWIDHQPSPEELLLWICVHTKTFIHYPFPPSSSSSSSSLLQTTTTSLCFLNGLGGWGLGGGVGGLVMVDGLLTGGGGGGMKTKVTAVMTKMAAVAVAAVVVGAMRQVINHEEAHADSCRHPDMKLNALGTAVILLVAFLSPRYECRALESPAASPDPRPRAQRSLPILQRLGEEYSLRLGRLGNTNNPPPRPAAHSFGSPSMMMTMPQQQQQQQQQSGRPDALYNRALQLRTSLTRRLLEGKVGNIGPLIGEFFGKRVDESMETEREREAERERVREEETETETETERARRSEDPPISLDLTFHLLREMMEMSRAEQMAIQAQSNRRMMELFGK